MNLSRICRSAKNFNSNMLRQCFTEVHRHEIAKMVTQKSCLSTAFTDRRLLIPSLPSLGVFNATCAVRHAHKLVDMKHLKLPKKIIGLKHHLMLKWKLGNKFDPEEFFNGVAGAFVFATDCIADNKNEPLQDLLTDQAKEDISFYMFDAQGRNREVYLVAEEDIVLLRVTDLTFEQASEFCQLRDVTVLSVYVWIAYMKDCMKILESSNPAVDASWSEIRSKLSEMQKSMQKNSRHAELMFQRAYDQKLQLKTYESILQVTFPIDELSADDVTNLKIAVSKEICKSGPKTALELSHKNSREPTRLTTGCTVLDQALRGGILCRGITEVAGESACGKTQFALQLSLTAQLPRNSGGLGSGTVYICTEDAFPSKRLYQMIKNFSSRHGNKLCEKGALGDQIFIEHVADFAGLMECIQRKVRLLLAAGRARLVVVDSVAAHFRSDYDSGEMLQRARHISAMATALQDLSLQHSAPIVCVNQVTSSMEEQGPDLVPALGLAWASHVTSRLMLSRTPQTVHIQQDSAKGVLETAVREMEVIFSPHLPNITVPYVIDHEGMKGFK